MNPTDANNLKQLMNLNFINARPNQCSADHNKFYEFSRRNCSDNNSSDVDRKDAVAKQANALEIISKKN